MNYKPSPLQVKLGECVWGIREMGREQGALGLDLQGATIKQLRLRIPRLTLQASHWHSQAPYALQDKAGSDGSLVGSWNSRGHP